MGPLHVVSLSRPPLPGPWSFEPSRKSFRFVLRKQRHHCAQLQKRPHHFLVAFSEFWEIQLWFHSIKPPPPLLPPLLTPPQCKTFLCLLKIPGSTWICGGYFKN